MPVIRLPFTRGNLVHNQEWATTGVPTGDPNFVVVITCPNCGNTVSLSWGDYSIAEDGLVSPHFSCQRCLYEVQPRLLDWVPPE